jgi:hypothetical protein
MKKSGLFIFAILLLALLGFVVAQDVCCERTTDLDLGAPGIQGGRCQYVDESFCEAGSRASPTSCSQTTYCQLGTCINENTGSCTSNTPNLVCIEDGGSWDGRDQDDIPSCQNGCCIIGEDVSFITEAECSSKATDFGIDINFRANIRDEGSCLTLSTPNEDGACVTEETRDCEITSKEDCSERFYKGLLCTAQGISDCAKSENTECGSDHKVYFLDTCDNKANVYDENMFSRGDDWTQEMQDYWTNIQEPKCVHLGGADESCGSCNYRAGSTCVEYQKNEKGMPSNAPEFGDNVCRELACYYDTNGDGKKEKYDHGESWCAESEGTYFHIPGVIDQDFRTDTDIENETKYNLPGSQYYLLSCWDGEVIPTECDGGYREKICKEREVVEGYTSATCDINDWRSCLDIVNEGDCEAIGKDCKWIYGYRFDATIVENETEQGSCVPLFTPGFEFWNPESGDEAFCEIGAVADITFYETWWGYNRDTFEEEPTDIAAHRCLWGCYAIPDYGIELTLEEAEDFYEGGSLPNSVGSYHLSTRVGQYCGPTQLTSWIFGEKTPERAVGKVVGNSVSCSSNDERRIKPLFYTHAQWLTLIRSRARSLGDCGVKANSIGEIGQPGSELITAIFDKLNQDGSIKTEGASQTIYVGEERIFGEYRSDEVPEEEEEAAQ